MKTEELIDLLATNVEAIKGGELRNALLVALAAGGAAALCLMLAIFGVPTDALGGEQLGFKALAIGFTLMLAAAGTAFLVRAARPGEPERMALIVAILLLGAMISAGAVAVVLSHPAAWSAMVFGPQWAACLVCIPLFAVAPFAALVWALRKGAPTSLMRTGAVIGLVAGALGAAVFALHHPGGSVAFIALWYGGPIVLCALVGAMLGPRLLRW